MGIRTIPCIFGAERIKRLGCGFVCVFMYKNMFGREVKCAENVQAESKTHKSLLFFFGLKVFRAIYNPSTLYKAAALQGLPPSKGLKSG